MKTFLKMSIVILLTSLICACATKRIITYEGFCRGFYRTANQVQDLKNPEPLKPPDKENPSYGQYNLDRQDMLKETNRHETNKR